MYQNHAGEVNEYNDEFLSIQDFKNYLRWVPERAMAIGYIPVDDNKLRNSRSSTVRLGIINRGKETLLANAGELGIFLQNDADAAKALGYLPKTKSPSV